MQNKIKHCKKASKHRNRGTGKRKTSTFKKGCPFSDNDMRETLTAFSEIIFVDATHKLLELQFPVYLFACRLCEVVGMGLLMTEDASLVNGKI